MPENIQRKVITEGLNLVIIKQLPQLFIEFHIENLTEDEYLVQFGFKDLQNVAPKNNETQVRAQVTPNSVVKITELVIKGSFAYKYQFAYQKLNQEPKEKIIEIVHGLNLKITQVDIQQKVLFELQSLRHEVSHLELTFTELNGITTQNNQTKFKIELAPKTNGSICELRFQGQMSYMYSYKFWFTQQPVDLKNLRKKLDMKIVESKNLFQGIDIDTLSIEEISYMLADSRFIDPQFSPVDYSIYANTKTVNVLQWARPEEFMDGEVSLYKDNIGLSDIVQGDLGDCWLMCALCALSGEENKIKDIIVNDCTSSKSVYKVKLFKNGEPVVVTIDDYFPCKPNGLPVFSRNNGSELWVLLLEKAYAKLHGSYYALKSGFVSEAIIDLTGCPAGSYDIETLENHWQRFSEWYKSGFKLVAGSGKNTDRKDIVSHHYYSITRLEEVGPDTKLIQLRNPWGDYEWLGDWSDQSELWTPELKEKLNLTLNIHDGSFWMCLNDFKSLFTQIMVTNLNRNIEYRFKFFFEKFDNLAKSSHCLEINVEERTNIIIGMHQEDERIEGAKEYRRYVDMGLVILKKIGNRFEFCSATQGNQSKRDIFWEGKLNEGCYLVVPLSTGISMSRPYDFKRINFSLIQNEDLHPYFKSTLKDLFRKINPSISARMKPDEIQSKLDTEAFGAIWNILSNLPEITIGNFLHAFLVLVRSVGERPVIDMISHLGYDEDLYSIQSKPVILSVQSEHPYDISDQILTAEINENSWQTYMHYMGNVAIDEDNLQIRKISHSNGCSLMAINLNSYLVQVSINMTEAQNIECNSSLITSFNLEAYKCKIFQHLQCERNKQEYKYPFTYTISPGEL